MPSESPKLNSWKKLPRYARIYGWQRAAVKAAGRGAPLPSSLILTRATGVADVSVIGCGQAAIATLCFFLRQERHQAFLHCYDPEPQRAARLARFYSFAGVAESAAALLSDERLGIVYIASNHASHAGYAIQALARGLSVFVEKPVATTWEDLRALEVTAKSSAGKLYVGYNRPFSAAIARVRELLENKADTGPLTMHCRVQGHVIPPDHWYRQPEEGTRISGNAGHWLDLFVHLTTAVRKALPEEVRIELHPENPAEPDDNYRLTVETAAGDSLLLHFTSYTEPADGVHEDIRITYDSETVHIDDFRTMKIETGKRISTQTFRPKDVGHLRCTLQPWLPAEDRRNLDEVWSSARLVLHATELALRGGGMAHVNLSSTPPASFEGA